MYKKSVFSFLMIIPFLLSCSNKKDMSITSHEFNGDVEFHSELQLKYINSSDYTTTFGIVAGSSEKSLPEPIKLTWDNSDPDYEGTYKIKIIEKSSNSAKEYETSGNSFDLYNVKLNNDYTYEVYLPDDSSITSGETAFKTTSKGPRNLYIENVMNARDLGGHGIKQSLIYRSGRFNEEDGSSLLSDASKATLSDELSIKTEIDLRRYEENGNISSSPISSSVNYKHLPMHYGGENILTFAGEYKSYEYNNPAQIKVFFSILADEKNYPISFHCSIGKDRTGCMAYLIEALCDMETEFIYRDYLFSNFAKISSMCEMKDIDDKYGKTIASYEGNSLSEKVYNYLHEVIGVSTSQLDSVIEILQG